MAWIESHQELRHHPKTKRFVRAAGISLPTAIGHLHCLWWWALDYAQNGTLSQYTNDDIADAAGWEGDSSSFIEALVVAGFVDQDGDNLYVHDWHTYAGRLIESRKANSERAKKSRERKMRAAHADDSRNVRATCAQHTSDVRAACGATVPNRTQPNQQDSTQEISPHSPPTGGEPEMPAPETPAPPVEQAQAEQPKAPDKPKAPRRRKPSELTKVQEVRFNRFWEEWPHKVSLGQAEKAWAAINPDDELTEQIIAGVRTAVANDYRFRETRYTPHPATWLNGKEWRNEYGAPRASPPPGATGNPFFAKLQEEGKL